MSYFPDPAPADPAQLTEYIEREFRRIGAEIGKIMDLEELHTAPERVSVGMVRMADGTSWNPGSGQGVYLYNGTTWVKL